MVTKIKTRDPQYAARFGFVEFATQESANNACSLTGTELDGRKLRITRSNTPITPPNPVLGNVRFLHSLWVLELT